MHICPTCHQALHQMPTEADANAIRSKSTEREAQNRKLVALLRIAKRNTYELRKLGISHPAGRVQDIEADGYVIRSDRVSVVDENGFLHPGVALYTLVSEPTATVEKEAACS